MTMTEDRLRELFTTIEAPDTPPPGTDRLRRRAQRHRLSQAGAVIGSVALVIAGVVGAITLSRGDSSPGIATFPQVIGGADTRTHLATVPTRDQWRVSKTLVAGTTEIGASWRKASGQNCVTDAGVTWCADATWPATVADDTEQIVHVSGQRIAVVVGRVPVNAAHVSVRIGDRLATATAELTPTSSHQRFFAALVPVPNGSETPIVGVRTAFGQPVAPPTPGPAVATINQPSHVATLPADQQALVNLTGSHGLDGTQLIAYRAAGSDCVVAARNNAVDGDAGCASARSADAPAQARPLLTKSFTDGLTVVLGDAPAWTRTLIAQAGGSQIDLTLFRVPGINDRVFWTSNPLPSSSAITHTCDVRRGVQLRPRRQAHVTASSTLTQKRSAGVQRDPPWSRPRAVARRWHRLPREPREPPRCVAASPRGSRPSRAE